MTLSKILAAVLSLSLFGGATSFADDGPSQISDKDIVDAYQYFLARDLVLRQEHLDFRDSGFKWNKIYHRPVGGVTWANPNLDVAYSEAWIGLDQNSCTVVNMPKINHRYYTFQVLNSWGETVSNINDRTFPKKPFGNFAYCTKGSTAQIPKGSQKIEVDGTKFRVLARVELGAHPEESVRLQKQITLKATGAPKMQDPVKIALFTNKDLPGVEMFDTATAILNGEPDINPGMADLRSKTLNIARHVQNNSERAHIDEVIRQQAIPTFFKNLQAGGANKNGWGRATVTGNYGSDYLSRAMINYAGIWANNANEVVYFKTNVDGKGQPLNGSSVYMMTFPKEQMPRSLAQYFWSVIVVDSIDFKIIKNPENKYLINKQNNLQSNRDGSVTIVFAHRLPTGFSKSNWLPTPAEKNYNLTLRFYGPKDLVKTGGYFPPALIKSETGSLALAEPEVSQP